MSLDRPDLSHVPEAVLAYIETLEAEIERLRQRPDEETREEMPLEPSEPPTTINLVTISAQGMAKRTPRHFYLRQRRSGMGIFDLDSNEDDPPKFLAIADETAGLLLMTDHGRAFRLPLSELVESPVRSRGRALRELFPLRSDERLALAIADQGGAYLALVTERGQLRRIGSQYLGKSLQPGTVLYNIKEGGPPAAACWTTGNDELLIVTRSGQGIRFSERLVPLRGCLGIRVDPDDVVTGVAAAEASGGAFLLGADGKGTVRLLNGFGANKSPGAGGKTVMKSDALVGAVAVGPGHDLFVISRLGKIIRFQAAEVPAKEGVVQGVNCMALRADECVAVVGCAVA
ncbi:MAG TPA: DNA gyrase C-terminal beta-propeller domain-containing protein [Caldilineaceae bacterium]|nr:DNA gyrase C-terminal beta-propeller domain-containing protein [Caldilineaceae bacterium]